MHRGMEFHEACNLAAAVQQLWKLEQRHALYFPGPSVALWPQLSDERSYFRVEDERRDPWHRVLRPGWHCQWIRLHEDDDLQQTSTVRAVADLWGLDDMVTVAVRATCADEPNVILADEVTDATVAMRLVFCEGLPGSVRGSQVLRNGPRQGYRPVRYVTFSCIRETRSPL